eukprot:m.265155 g.265155  ORF g.265155 m.265155 type:complete len:119 (+) comp40483_c0_seq1:3303-3659(+)
MRPAKHPLQIQPCRTASVGVRILMNRRRPGGRRTRRNSARCEPTSVGGGVRSLRQVSRGFATVGVTVAEAGRDGRPRRRAIGGGPRLWLEAVRGRLVHSCGLRAVRESCVGVGAPALS